MPQPEADKITVATRSLTFTYEGGEQPLSFSTNHAWQISWDDQGQEWCMTHPSEGSEGHVTLTVSATTNPRPESRTTTLILTAGNAREEVVVRQEAQDLPPVNTEGNEGYTDENLDWDLDLNADK